MAALVSGGTTEKNGALSGGAKAYALGLLFVVYTFNFIDRQILAILIPSIKAEFTLSDTMVGFLTGTAFAMFYATLGIPIAMIADRANRRNLIAVALTLWSGMTALSGVAQNVTQLALARIGVGVGEAGCSPPAHSMISDYFPPHQRSTAMGVYSLGIMIGIMLAFIAGGWVADNIGWRQAFFMVGVPGLVLALLVRFTIAEPVRGMSEGRTDSNDRPSVLEVAKFLSRRKAFVHMAIGAGLSALIGYSVISFFSLYINQSFGLSPSQMGVYLGLIFGLAGGTGVFFGGYIADRLGRINRSYSLWSVAVGGILAWPFAFGIYLAGTAYASFAFMIIPVVLSNFYQATTFAQTQSLVGLRMRGVAAAILLFIINIIGLGVGPQLTGALSDALSSNYGLESVRYSLLIVNVVIGPWAVFHYYVAGKYLAGDLDRVDER